MGVNREYVADWTSISFDNSESLLFLQYMKRKSLAGSLNHKIYEAIPQANAEAANVYFGGNMTFTDKIIFIPHTSDSKWPYYNLNELSTSYINRTLGTIGGVTTVTNAYCGGVLNDEGRLYLVPYGQATATTWHYIDENDTVVAYTHAVTCVVNAYIGGALGINGSINNFIYFAPSAQATATYWHYIDSGIVRKYTHTNNAVRFAYWGAVCNAEGNIYFIPDYQATATTWHYIDTSGTVQEYANNYQGSLDVSEFHGGVLASDGKIFLVPYHPLTSTSWYYIYNNEVYRYEGSSVVSDAYCGGVLAPNGRIYLIPYNQATATTWHYINTTTAIPTVVAYSHGIASGEPDSCVAGAYVGGVLAPNGRIYLIPYNQGTATTWHFIDTQSTEDINSTVATSPFYNKL